MKRLLSLICVLCMGFQCERYSEPIVNRGEWRVKNDAGMTVWVKPVGENLGLVELGQGEELTLTQQKFPIHRMPEFSSLLKHWGDWAPENVCFSVLSADGSTLREWRYADVMPTPEPEPNPDTRAGAVANGIPGSYSGGNFFVEGSWTRSEAAGERDDEIDVTWLFTIAQHDIVPLPEAKTAPDTQTAQAPLGADAARVQATPGGKEEVRL